MKTIYYTKPFPYLKNQLLALILLLSGVSFAQVTPTDPPPTTEPEPTGYNTGKVEISDPNSIVNAYTYDPVTNRYIYTRTVDGFNINYPIILTPKEYEELVLRESMREYFKKKSNAMNGDDPQAKKDLLPRYYVNSSFFETIFGSNTIDVKPTGSVEMDLGVRYTKQDNPSFSPKNRSQFSFDFDQRISMSLNGKVGTRLSVNANYDTESTFAFQNLIKLEYAPTEDDIIQKIEVGNVSMPLTNSLIRGAQSLFGVKAQLQFGKTTVTGVFSEQKSQTKSVTAQGGGTIQDFQLFALDYDNDRHFFLSQYFRDRYDKALANYPFINSQVQITRIEVWVTNKQNRVSTTNNNLRNIIALQDLGEGQLSSTTNDRVVAVDAAQYTPASNFFSNPLAFDQPSDNSNNKYDPAMIISGGGLLNTNIRDVSTASGGFNNIVPVDEGTDYSKLENARKLSANEFTFNPQLGYISLQQRLSNDEVLAVAYQYTIGSQVYQVGEFGTDGVDATVVDNSGGSGSATISSQSLVLKMLKSTLTNVQKPIWNLMMKNIYQIQGGYQLQQEDFRFNILYTDPSPLNYITQAGTTALPADVKETPLLKVFNVDRLNYNNDPQAGGDGFFDFIPGLTVDQQNGRLIFTTVEPFGKHLFDKLRTSPSESYYGNPTTPDYNSNQAKYVFRSMYTGTQSAALQDAEKNKFQLKGRYKSSGGDGIPIGAYNVPRGSVVVTAGGRVLQEGIDYSVNYQAGRVQILDPSLQASNTPIQVSVENNSNFGQQTRRFMGVNIEHKFSDKLLVGGTFIKMTERPLTGKSNYGQESVNNSIFGFNANYSTEIPFLTRMVNKLPNIDTDVPSNFSLRGEIAFLKPDTPKTDRFEGESTVYVDDFEGSQTTIDMRSALSWSLSSVPKRPTTGAQYLDFGSENVGLSSGYKRARLNWYSIDPQIYTSPGDIGSNGISANNTRKIFSKELYPNTQIEAGQSRIVNTLDLSYFPEERGPYNYNPLALNPGGFSQADAVNNFGGIMRAINSTNFEQSNVEYIQFWVLDPYVDTENPTQEEDPTNTGYLYFNLGEISEDVLKDGHKQFENGLPANNANSNTAIPTYWGRYPTAQSLIYAFDVDGSNRGAQDIGLDGINDAAESTLANIDPGFAALTDPANDNYQYFLSTGATNIFDAYKYYNGVEGNSPVDISGNNRGSTTIPDVEDINRDNTMNEANAYYEYKIEIKPGITPGNTEFVSDVTPIIEIPASDVPNGQLTHARWIQFKIPVSQPTNVVGSISDFRSIRFMRMFMTGFKNPITLRFGALDLVRGEWRRYVNTLQTTDTNPNDDNTNLDVLAVNIEENSQRYPIHYVSPPGVIREQQAGVSGQIIAQNEQSLSLRVNGNPSGTGGLEAGDARAVFKNVDVDMRQYSKLKMFLHAEALTDDGTPLQNDQMKAFIRFGNDFTNNYYEVEIPLKVSPFTATTPEDIWPELNNIDLPLALLTKLKILAMSAPSTDFIDGVLYKDDVELDPSLAGNTARGPLRLGVKGNPNFGLVRTLMVGIKNNNAPDPVRGEVWFNELRLADMDNKGGMAAVMNMDTNLADFATISATGRMSTIGFGALEEGPQERSREDMQQYNIVTNLALGKLLPKKWGINLPFNYAVGEEIITPKYDPFNQDIPLQLLLDNTPTAAARDNIENRAQDFTKRKSINFIGVKKERSAEQKPHVYDPENLTLSYSYNQVEKHNYEIENYIDQQVNTTVDYTYSFQNKAVEPFKKTKFLKKSSYWKMLSDFNFNYLPSSISFSSNIIRQYNKQQFRQVDVNGIGIDPLFRRNYMFNYQYGFNYNLTKALKVNFTAASHNIVRNYMDENNVPDNSNTIWTDFWNIGSPDQHNQQITVNYELPLNKLPFLSFVKSTYSYTGDYNWQRAPLSMASVPDENDPTITHNLGNTIQNAASHRLNTVLNMESFYKYIGLGKKPATAPKQQAAPKPGEKITAVKAQPAKSSNVFLDGLKGVLTSIKNVQINYTRNEGTLLPGYMPGLGFFGSSKPTLGFVFGSQDDVRYEAAKNGWLTDYQSFNQSYTHTVTKTIDYTANIDLFPDFKIDLTGNRTYANNFSEQYVVDPDGSGDNDYNALSPYNFGNFSVTTTMLKTAFKASDENGSSAFQDFRENRLIIANRLASQYYGGGFIPRYGTDVPIPAPTDPTYNFIVANQGYPVGFGKNNQAVLIPSFLAAYTGFGITEHKGGEAALKVSTSAFRDFPIPNWTIKYNGLMRYAFFKERFKRFSIQHAYRASYTINSFRSNLDYVAGAQDNGNIGNFYNKTIIGNVNLVEQFNPLIRVDFEMKNAFKILAEIKKDRSLSMSFDNNLLTEVQGKEFIVGFGYRFKDVIFSSQLADNPTGIIKSDINLKIDFSYRNNKTIVRYLDYDNNQLGGGQNIWSAKLTADYSFSKNLTAIFFYDHSFSKPVISTSFPLTNIRSGFTLRYNFGN